MDLGEWPEFLARWSGEWIDSADDGTRAELSPGAIERRWLGFDGAAEEQLATAEARLGRRLPPSYRQFLAVSNGWLHAGPFIYRLADTESVGWFRDVEPEWCEAYSETVEYDILMRSLCISTEGDAGVFLLDPEDVSVDGEWTAYHFANWHPGLAEGVASFRTLMEGEYISFHALEKPENATTYDLDMRCAEARAAILRGELVSQLPVLDEAVEFGRIGAQVTRIQIDALLGDWMGVRRRTMQLFPNQAEHLVGEPLLFGTVIPLFLLSMGDRPEQDWSAAHLIDNLSNRSTAPIPAETAKLREALATGAYTPTFPSAAFDDAVDDARQLALAGHDDEAWRRILEALPHWRPSGPNDVAPAALLADSVVGRLITPPRGHEILTTERGAL